MRKYSKLAMLALVCLSLSCKKSNEKPLTPEDLLSDKKWQLTAMYGEVPVLGQVDLFASLNSCKTDDFKEFRKEGTLLFDEGATKCLSSSAQSKTGSWSWVPNTDKKKMVVKEPGESDTTVDILELTSTTLKIRYMGITTYPTTQTYTSK